MDTKAKEQPSRRERDAARNRHDVLEAAEEVFAERGYVSASMEDVAKRADFSVGALYKFFKNKEDLYAELLRAKVDVLDKATSAVLAEKLSPLETIRKLYATRVELFWAHRRFFRLFFHQTMGTVCDVRAGFTPDIQERYEQFRANVTQVFEHGIRKKQFRVSNAAILTLMFEGCVRSYFASISQLETAERNEEEEEQVLAIFLEGALRQEQKHNNKKTTARTQTKEIS